MLEASGLKGPARPVEDGVYVPVLGLKVESLRMVRKD